MAAAPDGAVGVLLAAVSILALQIGLCRWWLARFRYGPLEWIWRSLTYGRRQPMMIRGAELPINPVSRHA